MFWNVRHFGRGLPAIDADMEEEEKNQRRKKHRERVKEVAAYIRNPKKDLGSKKTLTPDLFCLCEVSKKVGLQRSLMEEFPTHDFALTDGAGNVELLTAWRRGKFEQVIITQRREFQGRDAYLRPGVLASVKLEEECEFFNFLFLHTDSGREGRDYENRYEMFTKIWHLRDALAKTREDSKFVPKFVVMGDLNTMGRKGTQGSRPAIKDVSEIKWLEAEARLNGMRLLSKTSDVTWSNKAATSTSNLDHVLATKCNVHFNQFHTCAEDCTCTEDCTSAEVLVSGWNNKPKGKERKAFIKHISDHCSLFCEIAVGEGASESTSDDAKSS